MYHYQTGNHRCLIEKFYAKYHSGTPTVEKLIKFMKKSGVNEILKFTETTMTEKYFYGLISCWTPLIESMQYVFIRCLAKIMFFLYFIRIVLLIYRIECKTFISTRRSTDQIEKKIKINKPAYYTITKCVNVS